MANNNPENGGGYLAILGFLAMMLVLGFQAYGYFAHGTWTECSLNDVLGWATGNSWFQSPRELNSVHHALGQINAGFAIFVFSALPLLFTPAFRPAPGRYAPARDNHHTPAHS